MVNQKLGLITIAICFGCITTLTGLKLTARLKDHNHVYG